MKSYLKFAACLLLALNVAAVAQRKTTPKPAAPKTEAASSAAPQVAAQADAAREAGNLDEAITLYQQGVAQRPRWDEGWWYLATLLYERDRYAEAAPAFKRVAALRPKAGAPLALLGLCEYRLAQYDEAFIHLQQSKQLGLDSNPDLLRVARYHEATLQLLRGDFETAQRLFTVLNREGLNSQDLLLGMGLAVLRMAALPKQIEVSARDREMIRRAGLAQSLFAQLNAADARIEYDRLVADYPKAANVQYAYGRFLIDVRDNDGALAAFEREIANSPTHALARLQIAYLKLQDKNPAAGIPLAEEAIKLNARLPLGHYLLGRLALETGDAPRAVQELEMAQRLAPNEARVYYSLARAYTKVNRRADADRARETFARLNKAAEQSDSAIDEREPEKLKP
ncbi:MAG: tetratricopeptide repeat protein [Acidobacteria bacterium]|nr:tetratricopeptide repeat protein [Acidobacteriota bacterium]MBI3425694.1 tetratricopeptide repeat protein [Acidobacteriota bacterium]